MLGGLGYRRRAMMGGKIGLIAVGYTAYRAYQDRQSKTGGSAASTTRSSSGGGLAGTVRDVADSLTGSTLPDSRATGAAPGGGEKDLWQDEQAAESFSDLTALMLIRATSAAACSDGAMSTEERWRIMQGIEEAGAGDEDRRIQERQIAKSKPLDDLLAEKFNLASRATVGGETEANRAHLSDLRQRLARPRMRALLYRLARAFDELARPSGSRYDRRPAPPPTGALP